MRYPSSGSERGTVTAEYAIGIPAILAVLGIALSALRWGMDGVTGTTVAAETAFAIARGRDESAALSKAEDLLPVAEWSANSSANRVCVAGSIPSPLPGLDPQTVSQCVNP